MSAPGNHGSGPIFEKGQTGRSEVAGTGTSGFEHPSAIRRFTSEALWEKHLVCLFAY